MKALRVLVADDRQVVSRVWASGLARRGALLLSGTSEALTHYRAAIDVLSPDLAVVDVDLHQIQPLVLVLWLLDTHTNCRVVSIGASDDRDDVIEALRAGAAGYVQREHIADQLPAAIHAVMGGATWLPPAMAGLGADLRHQDSGRASAVLRLARLTPREREVFGHMVAGLGRRGVAIAMSVPENAARAYIHTVLSKLEVRRSHEAVLVAAWAGVDVDITYQGRGDRSSART